MRSSTLVCVVACAAVAPAAAQTPKYAVTVTADKDTNFAAFKSYSWEHGWQAYDKTVHADIMAAIDRELAALGLVKKPEGAGDLLVTYASLRRIDVDLKAKTSEANGRLPEYHVGTLVVLLLEKGTRKELFRGRVDKPIELEVARVKPIIDEAVAAMFAKYPTRTGK